jgi:hypothetical protein
MSVLNTASSDYTERLLLVKFEEIIPTFTNTKKKFEFYLYSLIPKKFHRLKTWSKAMFILTWNWKKLPSM